MILNYLHILNFWEEFIMPLMTGDIGQFRNNIRITAGLYTVDRIREQGVCDLSGAFRQQVRKIRR